MPTQTLSGTISRLISQFTRTTMFPMLTLKRISPRWSSSSNSSWREHLTHSRDPEDPLQPQAENFRFENDSDFSRFNHGQLYSYAAAHAGSQFCIHPFTLSIMMWGICKISRPLQQQWLRRLTSSKLSVTNTAGSPISRRALLSV